ncbi:DeoR/GlpR family transcriptional regulator of sugar metabolism [Pararhizobium capsulatum DSM 1112]|uniref:DeoR/GlpR family transcriptional regulator of sugar metabolism n=1 Tax=Pararhizobium capsulatum DSM 1112 TaxID=1121113 RepID=A0ABU0C2I3_9HYPH|nr:DeoR/GlpR family DNA-binding transcription regulator [Pararhizobium capsulatum]MDQ0324126.1 DeoR/GlpR family transcriptional regulator of sugar metabolism [Pararhizobium capsulatum DSM 1112]
MAHQIDNAPAKADGPQHNESKADLRRSTIVRTLMENGTAQIKDLAISLGVSLMTIHRDLNDLQDQGLVRRIRGAVTAEKSMLHESSYVFRARQFVDEKRRLARAAVAHIDPGNAVIWDDSSTTYHACDFIESVTPVTVITNAIPVIERLRDVADIELIALGGKYHRVYNGFFGLACEKAIQSYHVDVALMSTTTIQGLSLYTQDEQVLRVKQSMIRIARKKILLVDESKFHFSALNHVADLSVFDVVIVPQTVDERIIQYLQQNGINLELV